MSDTRAGGWTKFFAAMFATGVVFGAAIGLTSDRGNSEFITDSIGYDTRDQWYVHALMIGLTFVALAVALWFALFLARRFGPFLPGAVVLTVLGGFAVVLGAFGVGELETGLRILFVFMGLAGLGLAVRAWRAAWNSR